MHIGKMKLTEKTISTIKYCVKKWNMIIEDIVFNYL